METTSMSLHRSFTPFVPESYKRIFWEKFALKQALTLGPSHPKWLKAQILVQKIKDREVKVRHMNAMELGYLTISEDKSGWVLTPKGETFVQRQMKAAEKGNPTQKAQWSSEERAMSTLMERTFDVLVYSPRKMDVANIMWAELIKAFNQERQGKGDLHDVVMSMCKHLLHDNDEVDSDDEDNQESDPDLPEIEDFTSDDEQVDEDGVTQLIGGLTVANDPRSHVERILDLYNSYKSENTEDRLQALESELFDQVNRITNYGSDKEYFVLPVKGEFNLDKPRVEDYPDVRKNNGIVMKGIEKYLEALSAYVEEVQAYNDYRREQIRLGYSDSPNFEFLDLDIQLFRDAHEQARDEAEFKAELEMKNFLPEDIKKQILASYKELVEDLLALGDKSRDDAMRLAYTTVCFLYAKDKPEAVGKALASAC
jgi:hypothetical protein